MRGKYALFLGLLFGLLCVFFGHPALCAEKWRVAIPDFDIPEGVPASVGEAAYSFFITEIVESKHFHVLERQKLEKLLEEMKLQLSGTTATDQAIQVGALLNVQKLILGTIGRFEEQAVINVRLVDVTGGKVEQDKRLQLRSDKNLPLGMQYMAHLIISIAPIEGNILEVEGNTVRVNLGTEHGLEQGDRLKLERAGAEIRDLEGNLIGYERESLGTVKVTEVSERWSKGKWKKPGAVSRLRSGKEVEGVKKGDIVTTLFDEATIRKERKILEKEESLARTFLVVGMGSFHPEDEDFKNTYKESKVYKLNFHSKSSPYYNFLLGGRGFGASAKADTSIDPDAELGIWTGVLGGRIKYRFDLAHDVSVMPYIGAGGTFLYATEEIPSLKEKWFGPGYELFWGSEFVYKHRIGLFFEVLRTSTIVGTSDVEIGGQTVCFGITVWTE